MWPDEEDVSDFKDVGEEAEETRVLERTGEKVSTFLYERETATFSTEIYPWLYLGNADNAASKREMLQLDGFKMTHCLNCRMNGKTPFPKQIEYCVLKLVDEPSEEIEKNLRIAYDFIDKVRKGGGKILVHCDGKKGNPGNQSRASAILIGYLMMSQKITFKKALKQVQNARKKMYQKPVNPNHGFVQQLTKMGRKF